MQTSLVILSIYELIDVNQNVLFHGFYDKSFVCFVFLDLANQEKIIHKLNHKMDKKVDLASSFSLTYKKPALIYGGFFVIDR